MKKFLFFFLALVVLVGVGCGTQKNTTKSSSTSSATPVYLEEKLLNSFDSEGLTNIRFRFETELILTLIQATGNGKPGTDENGNIVIISPKVIRFPTNRLGKFISPSTGSKNFKATWDETYQEIGENSLSFTYDDKERLIIKPDGFDENNKPFVVYQGVKYHLPENYKTCFLKVGKLGKGEAETAPGVSTPGGN